MSAVSNSYVCVLPIGKPDPRQPRPEGKDTRRLAVQLPQKGNTCWYYGLKIIREQFGKAPHPSFSEERRLEQLASERRKGQTRLDLKYQDDLSVANQLAEDPHYMAKKINTLMGARKYLPQFQALQQSPSPQVREESSLLINLLTPFCRQNQWEDLHAYLREDYFIRRNENNSRFLEALKFSPSERYQADYPDKKPWGLLTVLEKAPYLDSLAFRASYEMCYHLCEAKWHPSQPISELISSLESHGPHYMKGMHGKSFYIDEPKPMKEKIQGRTVFYWPKGSERKELGKSHSIVVVGAKEGGTSGGLVYFIDPLDKSDPQHPELQKVYVISYDTLCKNLVNLRQEKWSSGHDGSVLYAEGVNYALFRSCP